MAFDPTPSGGSYGPWCTGCRQPILKGEPTRRVEFQTDPKGLKGLTGLYHAVCAKPFESMARVINMNFLGRF